MAAEAEAHRRGRERGNVQRLVDVQLARLPVRAQAAVVVEPVGHAARLLYLRQQDARAYGVHCPGGYEDHVPGLHRHAAQQLAERISLYGGVKLRGRDLAAETAVQPRTRLGIYYVPHLRLAQLPLVLQGIGIVRVYLDGEIPRRVYELHQYREAPQRLHRPAGKLGPLGQYFGQASACIWPVRSDARSVRMAGELPTLRQVPGPVPLAVFLDEPPAAPDIGLAGRPQLTYHAAAPFRAHMLVYARICS